MGDHILTVKVLPVIDTRATQFDGSLAVRFERLLDLYAPMTEQADGTERRDPSCGVISREDFIRLLDEPCSTSATPEKP